MTTLLAAIRDPSDLHRLNDDELQKLAQAAPSGASELEQITDFIATRTH